MKHLCLIGLFLIVTGCSSTHQDLKAPYDIDPMVPVLNQWDEEDTDHE